MKSFLDRPYWIFDMDGTLTVPVHDFAALRRRLSISGDEDILGAINAMPAAQAEAAHQIVADWEHEAATLARPQADAVELLNLLRAQGTRLGILTRNRLPTAHITLENAGLKDYFDPDFILGRDCAEPKPLPGGILMLLDLWRARPEQAVMVGDYIHDSRAGRAAGVGTILIERSGPTGWDQEADHLLQTLSPRQLNK
jgi:HAD superfamily hydrolase (TIGR01509 family)